MSTAASAAAFTVVGEAVVDLVEDGDGRFTAHPGGSPLNVAVALARLGHPTALLARLSTGGFGRRLREHAAANGVALDRAPAAPEPATLAAVTLDGHGAATYDFYTAGTADWQWTDAELAALPAGTRVVHTGSLATAVAPGAVRILALVERLRRAGGTLLSYDPNVRAGLVGDLDAARAGAERFVAAAHVVKASEDDVRLLYPGSDPVDVLQRWRGLGASLAVLTRGAAGAVAVAAGGVVREPGRSVAVVDTIGAGDAFTGGMLSALADAGLATPATVAGLSAGQAADVLAGAGRVAAITCTRAGADPPDRAALRAFSSG
ncbi:carbohydrate kinase [Dactylosporangium sucinum]|uniref:Ribokinase n=1 Tax=Dactylosporangium sucinum TaxID=1424081 RepID=A0A917T1A8_9ACTN|nr:carbohydrate kinase [Dactylosporangium sucinum]GGM06255.1 ribokinase [Dactylosporangium sucinum]